MTGELHRARLELMGGFRLTGAGGREVRLPGRKARALLAILALSPGLSATRARLKGLLWGSRGEQQAGDSLRQMLATLRKELPDIGPSALIVRNDHVGLDPLSIEVDVVAFGDAERQGDLATAAALYRGPLLDGIGVDDEEFETWLRAERNILLTRAIAILERFTETLAGAARVAAAQRLVALDPLREASQRVLIAAYLANGEAALAKRQFESCKILLDRELGVAPQRETIELIAKPAADNAHTAAAPGRKPTVAILPFANLSDDPAQRYFSDGITADIVTELSRFHEMQVRAHRPANGGRDANAMAAGRELGVNYVAEGSVRRLGRRIRVNVQLFDVVTGEHLWAERFDADEEDIFTMQDKIVRSIAAQLSGRLRIAGLESASRKPPTSMAAYDYVLRGEALPIGVPEAEAEARRLFQKAVELDPHYARAYAHLSANLSLEWIHNFDAPATLLEQSLQLAKKAVALDDGDEFCHAMLGRAHMLRNSHDLAEYHFLKSLALNPNRPNLMAGLGMLYGFRGEPERGLAYFREALAIDPHFDPPWYWRNRAVVHFLAREYEEAITAFKRSPIMPDWVEAHLAAAHTHLGRMEEARRHAAAALRLTPNLTIHAILSKDPYRRQEDIDHIADGLRKAGIPE
jgi:TolB-like protein/Tfp pilus assembly protein PilF